LRRGAATFVILTAIIAAGLYYVLGRETAPEGVTASGTVEVTEVTVAPLAGGRLLFLGFGEGDLISSGDLVARLSLDGLDSEEAALTAALGRERERLKALEAGNREEEIRQGEAELRGREIQLEQAERDARRYAGLLERDIVSKSDAERFQENARVLRESVQAARSRYALLKKGPRPEEIEQSRLAVKQIEAELEAQRLKISYKEVLSPVSGTVLSKNFERGEVVSPGSPLVTVGVTDDPWVKVYIPATSLGLIRVGQSAQVHIDPAPDGALPGTVRAIAREAEFNPRLSLTQEERANQVFWVKVAVSDDSGRVKPGMPADVRFLPPATQP
jgi:HlyD family secretion protein